MSHAKEKYCEYCGGSQVRYFSPDHVAEILDCPVKTVRGWLSERLLGSVKAGGLRRISAHDLDEFIERLPSMQKMVDEALVE